MTIRFVQTIDRSAANSLKARTASVVLSTEALDRTGYAVINTFATVFFFSFGDNPMRLTRRHNPVTSPSSIFFSLFFFFFFLLFLLLVLCLLLFCFLFCFTFIYLLMYLLIVYLFKGERERKSQTAVTYHRSIKSQIISL